MSQALNATAYINGKVITMDPAATVAEAVLTLGDKIVAVGGNAEIQDFNLPNTEVVDLKGKVLMPGLIDGHLHIECSVTDMELGFQAFTPPNNSLEDIFGVIRDGVAKTPPGEWVVVRGTIGYDKKIADQRHLNRWDLDAIDTTHPIAFFPAVHTCILNSKGIEKMGWFHEKFLPVNGTLGRDPVTGELTGIFCEVMETAPLSPWNYEQRKKALKEGAIKHFVSHGVTTAHENPYSFDGIRIWQELNAAGESPLRIKMFLPDIYLLHGALDFLQYGFIKGFGDNYVSLGGIKLFADGTMIHANGCPVKCLHYTQEEMDELVYKSHAAGMQVWTHAMSEEGFEQTLIAYERALAKLPQKDHRMRIEHSGEKIGAYDRCDEYVERMLKAGIGAMVTPVFQYAAAYYDPRSRFHTKGLIDRGFLLPGNSDSTGATPIGFNPWFSIWCAVTRKNYAGEVNFPEERISVYQALQMFTTWAAWGSFEEKIKGSIEPGKLADLVILGDDPLTCPADALREMPVEKVILGGETKWAY